MAKYPCKCQLLLHSLRGSKTTVCLPTLLQTSRDTSMTILYNQPTCRAESMILPWLSHFSSSYTVGFLQCCPVISA